MSCYVSLRSFWVQCCDVCYDFRIKMIFDSSLLPVASHRSDVLITLFLFFCAYWCSAHTVLCFVFLRLVYPMLPISLDCPFLIAPSAFSNVYFVSIKIPAVRWKSRPPTNVLQIKYSIILMISFRVHIFSLVAGKGTQQRYFLSSPCSTILTYYSL